MSTYRLEFEIPGGDWLWAEQLSVHDSSTGDVVESLLREGRTIVGGFRCRDAEAGLTGWSFVTLTEDLAVIQHAR